jgi:hypothetical protein
MGQKIMLEVTQPVVSGNEVVHHSGDLYASMDDVPDGVQVRPVIVSVPDAPAPAPKEPEPAAETKEPERPAKPAAKAPAK